MMSHVVPWLPDIPLSRLIDIVVKHGELWVIIWQAVGERLEQVAKSLLLFLPDQHPTIAPDDAEQEEALHMNLTEHLSGLRVDL